MWGASRGSLKEKMSKRRNDTVSSLFSLIVALGICLGSVRLSLGDLHHPGPGFFSFLAGAILAFLSLLLLLRSFRKPEREVKTPLWQKPERMLKIAYVMIALILYAIGMNYVGFALSTLLFLGFTLRVIEPQKWSVVFAVSILGAIVCYVVFQHWLEVQLPTGIFGF